MWIVRSGSAQFSTVSKNVIKLADLKRHSKSKRHSLTNSFNNVSSIGICVYFLSFFKKQIVRDQAPWHIHWLLFAVSTLIPCTARTYCREKRVFWHIHWQIYSISIVVSFIEERIVRDKQFFAIFISWLMCSISVVMSYFNKPCHVCVCVCFLRKQLYRL